MDKKLKMPLLIILGGYISSLGFYFFWYYYFFYGKPYRDDYFLVVVAVVSAITAVYLFPFLFILYIKSLQKVWTSFSLVSIITLLIFFFIPPVNNQIYYMSYFNKVNLKRYKTIKTIDQTEPEGKILAANKKIKKQPEDAKEKIQTEKKRMEERESKLNDVLVKNNAANKAIAELQTKVESVRKENDKLKKNLNETIKKTKFLEVIFRVQIISSSTRLVINSPKLKGLKNVWEYKDNGLYKYTIGNQKDLKSAFTLQSEFRRKGFTDAFVVAFKSGKRIPVREALKLLN